MCSNVDQYTRSNESNRTSNPHYSNNGESASNQQLSSTSGINMFHSPDSNTKKNNWIFDNLDCDQVPDESTNDHPSPSQKMTPSKNGVHTPYMGKWSKVTEASRLGKKLPESAKIMEKYVTSIPAIAQAQPSTTHFASSSQEQFDIYNYISKKNYKGDKNWYFKDGYFHEMLKSLTFAKIATSNSPKNQSPTAQSPHLFVKSRRNSTKKFRRIIMLDLDETLIRAEPFDYSKTYNHVISVKVSQDLHQNFGVFVRPFTTEFLQTISQDHKIVVYTASVEDYANKIVDVIDPQRQYIDQILSREQCSFVGGLFVKNLDIAIHHDIPIENVIIVDNYVHSYALHLDQGIPIKPFYGDMNDRELVVLTDVIHQSRSYPRLLDFMRTHMDFSSFYEFLEVNQSVFQV